MITYILAHCSGTEWWLNPPGHPFARERYSTKDQKTPQHPENRLCHKGKSMFWPFILNQTSPDWLHGWTDILVEPVRTVCHCPELRKCVFMAWSSNMARTLTCNHYKLWNHFSRRRGVLWSLVEHLPHVERCSGLVSQLCVPLQLDQKVCINGLIHYKFPEHWLAFMAKRVFQVLRSLLVLGRASFTGVKMFRFSQSVLCITVVGSESLYSWFDSV